jgi:hypothetical protein
MSYSKISHQFLVDQCKVAMSQNVLEANKDSKMGLIEFLQKKGGTFTTDIPVVFEYFSLLDHILTSRCEDDPIPEVFDETININELCTGIYAQKNNKKLLLVIDAKPGTLPYIAHWITDRIPSRQITSLPGTLILPFSLEGNEEGFLLPEWCAAFYAYGNPGNCIPMVTLQSMLSSESVSGISGDWITIALHRLAAYGLPVDDALAASKCALNQRAHII